MWNLPWFTSKAQAVEFGAKVYIAWGVVGGTVTTTLAAMSQMIRGIPLDWWALGSVFSAALLGSILMLKWIASQMQKSLALTALPQSAATPAGSLSPVIRRWFWAASPPFVCLIVEKSYVNGPVDEGKLPWLWVVWVNQGDEEIHLGKPSWVANVGKAYGHLSGSSLLCQYGRGQTKSDEVKIKHGERVEWSIGLDPGIKTETLQGAKHSDMLGELTVPVTFGKNKQRTITVRL